MGASQVERESAAVQDGQRALEEAVLRGKEERDKAVKDGENACSVLQRMLQAEKEALVSARMEKSGDVQGLRDELSNAVRSVSLEKAARSEAEAKMRAAEARVEEVGPRP
jgi:hypothetical protein